MKNTSKIKQTIAQPLEKSIHLNLTWSELNGGGGVSGVFTYIFAAWNISGQNKLGGTQAKFRFDRRVLKKSIAMICTKLIIK